MYVTIENTHYCITSHDKVELHPCLPFIYGTTSPVSHGISVECNGIDPSKLKSSLSHTTDFRPTRLIRTSDMTIVPGYEAINGYCAISYPWEWSGDVEFQEIKDDNNHIYQDNTTTKTTSSQQQKIIKDRGKHTYIAKPTSSLDCLYDFSTKKTQNKKEKNRRLRSLFNMAYSTVDTNDDDEPRVRKVTFKEIIQQLCWMFEIDYIWYDQLCIDQLDLKDKQNEIRQMHQIYGHAQFTLVMIPEMQFICPHPEDDVDRRPTGTAIQHCIQQIATSKWSKRAWTFEEAVLSNRLLFVGRDVHVWSDTIISTENPWSIPSLLYTHQPLIENSAYRKRQAIYDKMKEESNDHETSTPLSSRYLESRHYNMNDESYVRFVQNICSITSDTISASSALWHIHRGESTQDHDKIFALANIFPRLMDDINDFSYNQPLLPLMTRFYDNLIRHDLSVLCFGKEATHDDVMYYYESMDQGTKIIITPSWTGVTGSHMIQTPTYPTPPTSSFARYYITDGYLMVHSKSLKVLIEPLDRCPHASLPYNYDILQLCPTGTSLIALMDNASYRRIISYGLTPTHWLQRRFENHSYMNITRNGSYDNNVTAWFSLTTEVDIKNCIILMDVQFDIGMEGFKVYPVITKSGRYYNSIGIVFAHNLKLLFDQDNTDLDEFTIR
ncbi:hypothetical protein INT45_001516 [Circinella minor]|uniref:Heterokaryon incompatibility domain-containing protein n=1 Tax=Circinella minor TaxID=1195481 RepID=A0A8H7VNB8_9FUNG|nr:hypothetical protein INT45_001516 [Circinella minor]